MKRLILLALLIVLALPSVSVQAASISVTKNNQTLYEGGSPLDFRLKLSKQPVDPETVTVSYSTTDKCELSQDYKAWSNTGAVVTLSDDLGFRIRPSNDSVQEYTHSCLVNYSTTSTDNALNGLKLTQSFTIIDDNDAAATVPSFSVSSLGPSSITEGSSNLFTFSVSTSTIPSDPITVAAQSDSQCQLVNNQNNTSYLEQTISAGSINSVAFSAVASNDLIVEGDHSCTVNFSQRTNDTTYSGIAINNLQIPITDDEAAYDSKAISAEELNNRKIFGRLDSKDANNDGIDDEKQPNVVSIISPVNSKRIAIEIKDIQGDCRALSTPVVSSENDQTSQDSDFHYPVGLLSFKVICNSPGARAQAVIYLDGLYDEEIELRKYIDQDYSSVENVQISEFETQNGIVTTLSYELTDGGSLDEDKTKNGTIVDPVGVAISATEPLNRYDDINSANISSSDNWTLIAIPLVIVGAILTIVFYQKYQHMHLRVHKIHVINVKSVDKK